MNSVQATLLMTISYFNNHQAKNHLEQLKLFAKPLIKNGKKKILNNCIFIDA